MAVVPEVAVLAAAGIPNDTGARATNEKINIVLHKNVRRELLIFSFRDWQNNNDVCTFLKVRVSCFVERHLLLKSTSVLFLHTHKHLLIQWTSVPN